MVTIDSSTLQNLLLDNHLVKDVYAVVYTVNPETQVESQYRVNASSILGYGVRYDSMPTNHIGMGNAIPSSGYIKFLESDISFAASEVDRFKIYETTTGTGVGQQITVGLGTFYPDNYSFDDNVLTFEGYDFISFLDRDYSESELLDGDQMAAHTPKNWLKRAFVACGFPENKLTFTCENEDAAYTFEELTGTIMPQQSFDTFRSFAACVAGACGCNLIAGRTEGEAVLVSVGGTEDTTYRFPDSYVPISKLFSKGIAFTSIKFKNYSSIATGIKTDIYNITGSYPDGTKEKRYKFGKNPLIDPVAMWDEVNNRRGYLRARNRIIAQLESRLFTRFIYEITSVPVFDIGDRIVVEAGTKNLLITSWSYDGGSVTLSLGDPTSGSSVSTSGGSGLGSVTVNGKIAAALESIEDSNLDDTNVIKDDDSYLYNTLISQSATDGTLLEIISSKWLHADYKGDILIDRAKPHKNQNDKYVYTFRMAINKLATTGLWVSGNEIILDETVDYGNSTIDIQRHIQFDGYVDIEVVCDYPNIFTVQEAVLKPNSYQNELFSRIGWYEMQTFSAGSGITAFKPTFRTTDTEEGGIGLYVPVSDTQSRKLTTTEYTSIIKNIHLEIVSDDGGVFEFYESEVDDTDNPTQHRWKLVETAECKKLKFEDCFEITSTSVTNLSRVTVGISVLESRQSGDNLLRIHSDTYTYVSSASIGFNLSMFAPVPLVANSATVTSTAETTDGEYDYTTIVDTPHLKYQFKNQEVNLYGNLPNLVKSQVLEATATRTTTTSTRISTGTTWVSIDTDIGGQPRSGTRSTTTLLTDATNTIHKLVMTQDTDDTSLYNIDTANSDEEMYELYTALLAVGSENYTDEYSLHYFESGSANEYNDTYIYLDVIGSFNDLTYTTEYYNGKLILVGYGNLMESFTGELVEGVFIGNGGTGLYVDIAGESLTLYKQYKEYQLESVTYTIDFDDGVLTLTGSDGKSSSVILPEDTNTTYELTASSTTLYLTGSDGSTSTVTLPEDNDTTYDISYADDVLTLTGSDGSISSVTIESGTDITWADDDDITDSINEIFGTVLLTTEDSNTIITEDNYPIGV